MITGKEMAMYWKEHSNKWEQLAVEAATAIENLTETITDLQIENENLQENTNELCDAIDELQTEKAEIIHKYKEQSKKLNKVTDDLIEEKKCNNNLQVAINKLSEIIWGKIK